MTILVICRNEEIGQTIVRLLRSKEHWHAMLALTDENAIELFRHEPFDNVLIGSGVDNISEVLLSEIFKKRHASVKVIPHFGGGSGLLFNEIEQAIRM